MRRSMRGTQAPWPVMGLLIGTVAGQPSPGAGQQAPAEAPQNAAHQQDRLTSGELSLSCASRSKPSDPFLAEVALARDLESPEAAKAALDALEPEARRMAEEAPSDAYAQYTLAAVLGARLDHESGRDKMAGAEQVRDQAERVLELAPEHAGASYMLGKIHASILRLGGFKRFLAKSIFGGGALEGASWEEAQALLETAVRGEPCVPEHHFELARVYAQKGDAEGAERELGYVRELTEGLDGRQARLRERAEEMGREWRAEGYEL